MARAKVETTIKLATPSKPENKQNSQCRTDNRAMFDDVVQYLYLDSQSEAKQALSKRGVLQNYRLHVWWRIHIKYAIQK